jgi:hypothetical protein
MRAYYGESWNHYGEAITRDHGNGARYCGLNLHSHFYRRTVEFRIFNSSLNPMRIQTYIAICHALMMDAKTGKKRSINKSMTVGSMASGALAEDKALFQFLTVIRYNAGMSLQDYRNVKKIWKDSRPQVQPSSARW